MKKYEVIKGHGLGKKLGFPTINLEMKGETGVFLVKVFMGEKEYFGVMHRGKPMGRKFSTEIYLLNYKGNAYGKEVSVEVLEKMRETWKFDATHNLKGQIALDVDLAREKLGI